MKTKFIFSTILAAFLLIVGFQPSQALPTEVYEQICLADPLAMCITVHEPSGDRTYIGLYNGNTSLTPVNPPDVTGGQVLTDNIFVHGWGTTGDGTGWTGVDVISPSTLPSGNYSNYIYVYSSSSIYHSFSSWQTAVSGN